MEDKVEDIEVDKTLEKDGFFSFDEADFDAKVKENDDGTHSPEDKKVMVDLGISKDGKTMFSEKNKASEMTKSPSNIQRNLEDFKKDCDNKFEEINEKIENLNK